MMELTDQPDDDDPTIASTTHPPAANGVIDPPDANGVIRLINRVLGSNTYLVPLPGDPGACVIIDPGLDDGLVARAMEVSGLIPRAVLSTHGHFDHIGTAEPLRRRYGVPFCLHVADSKLARSANFLMTLCKIDARIDIPIIDIPIGENVGSGNEDAGVLGTCAVPNLPVCFRHIPGHTPGSCLIMIGGFAFSGDTLYRRGLDTLPLPGTDGARMRASILELWDSLPEETWIYPGHGRSAAFEDIKRNNLKLRAFLELGPAEEAAGDETTTPP